MGRGPGFPELPCTQGAWVAAPCGFRAQLLPRRWASDWPWPRAGTIFLTNFGLDTIIFRHNLTPHQALIGAIIGIIRRPQSRLLFTPAASIRPACKQFLPQGRSKTAVFGQKTQAAVRIAIDSPQ